jgi:hypothetical protein
MSVPISPLNLWTRQSLGAISNFILKIITDLGDFS